MHSLVAGALAPEYAIWIMLPLEKKLEEGTHVKIFIISKKI